MEPFDDALEKSAISEIDAALKRLNKGWAIAKRSLKEWDFKTSAQSLEGLADELDGLGDRWQEQETILLDAIEVKNIRNSGAG
jgi:hypothetical protein